VNIVSSSNTDLIDGATRNCIVRNLLQLNVNKCRYGGVIVVLAIGFECAADVVGATSTVQAPSALCAIVPMAPEVRTDSARTAFLSLRIAPSRSSQVSVSGTVREVRTGRADRAGDGASRIGRDRGFRERGFHAMPMAIASP